MNIKAITFDVFGTVVDWRTALIREVSAAAERIGVKGDWAGLVDAWKLYYRPAMDRVNAGTQPWTNVDEIYRQSLGEVLSRYALERLGPEEREHLISAWCHPDAWPDSAVGIGRLKSRFVVSSLSNGNFAWLVAIAKHCAIPFDCIITAENAKAYKPAPRIYQHGIELLGVRPEEVLMVACHNYDLAEARLQGMRTAFLPRKEHGPEQTKDQAPEQDWDYVVSDLNELAAKLGCA